MKPKTKFDFEVVRLSTYLPEITEKQIAWAYDHCIDHIGRVSKKGITCLDCRHTWDYKPILLAKLDGCKCPNCGRKLKVKETRQRVFKDGAYFGITTTHKGFQLFRLCLVEAKFYSNKAPEYSCHEVVQRWISKNGKTLTLSVPRYANYGYSDIWQWWGEMEIRKSTHAAYSIIPYKTYPAVRYLPEIKRNGFKGEFHGINPYDFYSLILRSNEAETLLKCNEIEWFKFMNNHEKHIKRCWPAIKIALRYKMNIKDKYSWLDYIDLLLYFKKDIRNPQVIIRKDWKVKHDQLVRKKRRILAQLELEKKKLKLIEDEEKYLKMKGKFFGLAFSDDLIAVKVLNSVQEIISEGDTMHHCVYTNDYHLKPDSLILSATVEGVKMETIEVSIKQFKIIQVRGKLNQNTEYHDRIIELVNKNMHLIKERLKPKKKKNGTKKNVNSAVETRRIAV